MHELRMFLLWRLVPVSALQDSESKNNGGAIVPLQLGQGGGASLGLGPSSSGALVLSPGLRHNFFHALKAFSLEGTVSHGCSDGKHDTK
jgi:hypothetical protein